MFRKARKNLHVRLDCFSAGKKTQTISGLLGSSIQLVIIYHYFKVHAMALVLNLISSWQLISIPQNIPQHAPALVKFLSGTLPFNWWFLLVTPLCRTRAQLSQRTNGGWQSAQNWVAAFSSQSSHILCFWGALLPPLPAALVLLPLLPPLPLPPLVTVPRGLEMTTCNHK